MAQALETTVKDLVRENIDANPVLVENTGVNVELLTEATAEEVAELYRGAYQRADWFGDLHANPEETMFNPAWMLAKAADSNYTWIVFTGEAGVLGSTSLQPKGAYTSIDETQLDPVKGRRMGVMSSYFRRFVPLLQQHGVEISTEFVLTPGSVSLRKRLLNELGMLSIGIHPSNLTSRVQPVTRSEISSVWAPDYAKHDVDLIPEAVGMYNAVAAQLGFEEKQGGQTPIVLNMGPYQETRVSAQDRSGQQKLYSQGFVPVAYHPVDNELVMARFPLDGIEELEFLRQEPVPQNIRLLDYIQSVKGVKR